MKKYILFLFVIAHFSCDAQHLIAFDYNNFEKQFLAFEPVQNAQTSDSEYEYGRMIIRETKSSVENDPSNFNVAYYFNALSAFITLNESDANVITAFKKFIDADGSCDYILSYEKDIGNDSRYDVVRADYVKALNNCKQGIAAEADVDIVAYCKANNLNVALVQQVSQVLFADQKHRNASDAELRNKQQLLDEENQEIIDSLFAKYKAYLGRSLVGKKYETTMWSVIQHSNPEMMARYLPVVHKAVKDGEITVVPFKMLVDRYYGLTYGYQIFGSQSGFGFDLADDETRRKIELKYGIE